MKPGKSYPVKHSSQYNWWERERMNAWDTDESIWLNANMIWIVGFAPMVIGLPIFALVSLLAR